MASSLAAEIENKFGVKPDLVEGHGGIYEVVVNGKTVYSIGGGALIVCLADAISLDVVEGIAALKEELEPELMRVVFKDAGFTDDVVKTNAVQILRQAGIADVKSL